MKSKIALYGLLMTIVLSLNSCAAVEGIFKAGAATGIIAVVIVIALIIFVITRFRGKKNP